MDPDQLRRRRLLTVVVMMATIMQALDGTIANVALPSIQGSLSATQEQVAWVITSYIVSAAIATPLAGFCAVRFGVRRILVSSVIGFTIDFTGVKPTRESSSAAILAVQGDLR